MAGFRVSSKYPFLCFFMFMAAMTGPAVSVAGVPSFEILINTDADNKKLALLSEIRKGETTTRELGLIEKGTAPLAITNNDRSRLIVRYTDVKRRHDELVVYSLPGLTELARHTLGLASQNRLGRSALKPDLFHLTTKQEQLVTVSVSKNQWSLHTLSMANPASIHSLELGKGVVIGQVFPSETHAVVATAKEIRIVDLKAMTVTGHHELTRKAYFDLVFDPDQPVVHILERLEKKLYRDPRSYGLRNREILTLITMDPITGEKKTVPLGYQSPVVIGHPDNKSLYLSAKTHPHPTSDLIIWRLRDGGVELVHTIPNERDPFSVFVYEPADRLVLFYISTDDLVYSLGEGELLGQLRTPVKPVVDPLIRDQRYAYLTSAIGSNVSLVDLKEAHQIEAVSTGRTEIKVLQGAMSILGFAAAQVYGIGFAYLDFATARTRLKFDERENQVLVMNTGTNDLSVLDADTLAVKGHVPVGGGGIGIFKTQDRKEAVTLSTKRLTVIDPTRIAQISAVTEGELTGLNAEAKFAYFLDDDIITRYSLEDGQAHSTLPVSGRVLLMAGPTGSRSMMETFDVPALVTFLSIGYGPRGLRLGSNGAFLARP